MSLPVQLGIKGDDPPAAHQLVTVSTVWTLRMPNVYGTTTVNPTLFNTSQPVMDQNRQRNRIMRKMFYPKFHRITGIIVLLLSIVVTAVEISGSMAMKPYIKVFADYDEDSSFSSDDQSNKVTKIAEPFIYWSGSWVGVLTLLVGIMQLFTGVKLNPCCMIVAMMLECLSCFFMVVRLPLASTELGFYRGYFGFPDNYKTQIAKQYPAYEAAINLNIGKAAVVLTFIPILGILFLVDFVVSCYEICCRPLREVD